MYLDGESQAMVRPRVRGRTQDGEEVEQQLAKTSENYELCRDLLRRLKQRGFGSATERLLAVLDGADALSKAVREAFPQVEIQRCWVHKERNLQSYLNKKDHAECSALTERVRKAEGAKDGEAAYGGAQAGSDQEKPGCGGEFGRVRHRADDLPLTQRSLDPQCHLSLD